jgi:hypothetical protein
VLKVANVDSDVAPEANNRKPSFVDELADCALRAAEILGGSGGGQKPRASQLGAGLLLGQDLASDGSFKRGKDGLGINVWSHFRPLKRVEW